MLKTKQEILTMEMAQAAKYKLCKLENRVQFPYLVQKKRKEKKSQNVASACKPGAGKTGTGGSLTFSAIAVLVSSRSVGNPVWNNMM